MHSKQGHLTRWLALIMIAFSLLWGCGTNAGGTDDTAERGGSPGSRQSSRGAVSGAVGERTDSRGVDVGNGAMRPRAGESVSTDKNTYAVNEAITVTWGGFPTNVYDWIALSAAGSAPGDYIRWAYTDGAPSGSKVFAGLPAGSYEARGHLDNGNTVLAVQAFSVGTQVSTNKTTYAPNEDVIVNFSGLAGNSNDWVAIAPAGSAPTEYVRWTYTNGDTTGSRTFAGIANGTYVARAFYNDSYVVEAESASFQIGGTATVARDKATYTQAESAIVSIDNGPGNASAWVGLFAVGSANTAYVAFNYTGGVAVGNWAFPLAGYPSGQYEARLFGDGGYNLVATSPSFQIGTPVANGVSTDKASYGAGETVTVNWGGLPGNQYDWISIAPQGAAPEGYVAWKYTNGAQSGTTTFPNLIGGTYVARAHVDNGSPVLYESAPFTVGSNATCTLATPGPFNVGDTFTVNFTGMSGAYSDWVGIATPGSANESYLGYEYTGGGTSGSTTFSAAEFGPGTYVARCFNNGGYQLGAESVQFTINP